MIKANDNRSGLIEKRRDLSSIFLEIHVGARGEAGLRSFVSRVTPGRIRSLSQPKKRRKSINMSTFKINDVQ